MVLYAAVRGTTLYVATWSPGSNNNASNDHFIVVADQLSPTLQPAFQTWSKIGSNAVVVKAVPHNVTVAGVPAKIVGEAGCAEPSRTMDQMLNAIGI